jgi:hypothetical protein
MSTTFPAHLPARPPAPRHHAEHATHGIDAHHPFVVDSIAVLDHRTRERAIAAATAPSGRYLSIANDDDTVLIALDRPITHIGRGLIADVRLEDPQVSRRHAIVAVRGDAVRILDDRSSNGTFVNGRQVTVAELTDGDVIRFGRVAMRYVEVAPRRASQPLRRIQLRSMRAPRRAAAPAPAPEPRRTRGGRNAAVPAA